MNTRRPSSLLAGPDGRALLASSVLARLPLAMLSIAFLVHVQQLTGSFAVAGLACSASAICGAFASPGAGAAGAAIAGVLAQGAGPGAVFVFAGVAGGLATLVAILGSQHLRPHHANAARVAHQFG